MNGYKVTQYGRVSSITLALFALAVLCYLLAGPVVGTGLFVLGVVFEFFGWISAFSKKKK